MMRCTFFIVIVVSIAFSVMFSTSSMAAKPVLLGTYGDWRAYSFVENNRKVCYMAAQPQTDVGNYTQRGDIYALVTHRPADKTNDVFSYVAGYPYKSGSETTVQANGRTFKLFTQDSTAWAVDAAADRAVVEAIRGGSTMVVKGTSKRGTLTTDTFALKGSSKAYKKISEACRL